MKKLRFIFLAVIILATMVAFSVCANAEVLSGKCGENVSYTLNTDTGELRIFGTGKMDEYRNYGETPWYNKNINIKNVIIEYGVTSIGGGAFSGCISLTNIIIPNSVTSIGGLAFYYCASLTNITIPDSVTEIGSIAFYYCTGLTNITIPDSVISIGASAFEGCTSLTNITIPDSVTSIGGDAFEGCTSLTNITIPDSVTSIGGSAFSGCTSLTNITIPDSVISIGASAFEGCTGLQNTVGNLIYIKASDKPYFYLYDVVNTSITSCIINENTKFIGDNVFKKCTSLTNITIPDSVTEIGYYAFYDCESLTNITIPDSVTSIGSSAFSGCTSLTNITIPDSVTFIGTSAFRYCESLTNITIPDGVTFIGAYAFEGCTSLMNITIPDSVTLIGVNAFYYCTSLTNITIPDSVTFIDAGAFEGCTSLTNITIPGSVTSIGVGAFEGCTGLQNTVGNLIYIKASDNPYFYLDGAVNKYIISCTINENTKFIGGSAFSGCRSLTNITIPDSVTEIGDHAFSWCTSLTNITIPDGVTSIGGLAFCDCTSLTSITISDGVTSIDYNAFEGCTSLTNITIPGSVTSIDCYAFDGCTSLASITIPDSVTYIGDGAFKGCPNLTITGYEGSYAEEYAKENNIPFNAIPKHTHSYTSEVIKSATCTSVGSKKFTCSCGDTYTEAIAKLPHESDNWTILIPAKAGAEGVECGLCKVCGVVAMRSIEALPKDRPVFRLTPTKTESGYAVTLSLENNVNGFYSLDVIVKYDAEKLVCVNADTSNAVAKFEAVNTNGTVLINYTDTAYMPNKGELCTMYFEPNGDLLSGNTEVVINTVVSDNPYTAVNCTVNLGEEEAPENTTVIMTIGQAAGFVSGKAYALDAAPIIRNDRTMLPVRFVAEAFGAEVGWDGATSTATVKTEEVEMRITIGASTAIVNGEEVALDSPAFIENSRTYLPVRFVAENLGASVAWNGVTSTATLTK